MEKRKLIKKEILSTEKTYVETLDKIQRIFLQPLIERRILTKQQLTEIFSNLQDIIKINAELYLQLQERIECEEDMDVADVFINMSPFLKIYAVYAKNYTNAVNTVAELTRKNAVFACYINTATRDPDCQGLKFEAFILTPIQRIPRYKLLLQDLLKYTPETHSDHLKLQQALNSIEQVALFLNETIRRHEIILQMLRLQKQISGFTEDLIVPGRILIKKGILTKIYILIYASVSNYPGFNGKEEDDSSYTFHRKFTLDDMRIIEDGSSFGSSIRHSNFSGDSLQMTSSDSNPKDLVFQVMTPLKSFALICSSIEEKKEWIRVLNETIDSYKANKSTLKLESPTPREYQRRATTKSSDNDDETFDDEIYNAPVWVPDSATKNCMECQLEFTLIRRRHHCRSCGRVLCSNCTRRRTQLPSQYEIPKIPPHFLGQKFLPFNNTVRVCEDCFVILEAKLMELKKKLLQSSINEMERPLSNYNDDFSSIISNEGLATIDENDAVAVASDSDEEDNYAKFERYSRVIQEFKGSRAIPVRHSSPYFTLDGRRLMSQSVVGSWSHRIRSTVCGTNNDLLIVTPFSTDENNLNKDNLENNNCLPFYDLHNVSRPASIASISSSLSNKVSHEKKVFKIPSLKDMFASDDSIIQ